MSTDEKRLRAIADELLDMGYWYPPDGILAVIEGRPTYHPLDPTVTYEVRKVMAGNVRAAIERADRKERDLHDPNEKWLTLGDEMRAAKNKKKAKAA